MNFVDFHTHLDWYDQEELFGQLAEFSGTIVSASENHESFIKNLKIAEDIKKVNNSVKIIPTCGIHPKNADKEINNLSKYQVLCEKSPVIGEIGMDFCWYKNASAEIQETVFRYFLEHCNKFEKYCVIHTKDAEKQIGDILLDYPKAKPIIHWYDGPEEIYLEFIKRGYMQTFGCETIRSKHIQKLLKQTPLELILAETDNPTAEPWLGGKNNSVQLIKRVYSDIAQILELPEVQLASIINSNSQKIINSVV